MSQSRLIHAVSSFVVLLVAVNPQAALGAELRAANVKSPMSAEQSLQHFHLDSGLRIELVAAEPDVVDPVAVAFDEDGRLWVAEMRDYPDAPAEGQAPQSCIKILQDRDGDGRYEVAETFAEGLLYCTGLQPWRGGVIATLSSKIAYLRDNDGDGRVDLCESWFSGFQAQNSQHVLNHPTLALDNRVYVANGRADGQVVAVHEPWRISAQPLLMGGMDFRFDPISGQYDAVTGYGQFGLTFDEFGNRFICVNHVSGRH